ncbi:hypothetical protein ABEB36_010420 [Hypothenemus hampei]|uniref:MADF domain-containing protein n=1 Tax=Hypothenemus hampei TaxID=57062 RepID=A0ABD1EJT6_HYPHA
MDVDIERLIILVQERPALYNIMMKDHHNRDLLEKLWEEISTEVGVGVTECKNKWNSVRSSYSRYLRHQKKLPSGSGTSKRKKWYLADNMTFLKDFMGQHRQPVGNATIEETSEIALDLDQERCIGDDEDTQDTPISITSSDSQSMTQGRSKPKVPKMASVVGAVAGPMIKFLESRTTSGITPKDSTLTFLKV